MNRWYEIHQSQLVRERLREAEDARLAAEAGRVRSAQRRAGRGARGPRRLGFLRALFGALD